MLGTAVLVPSYGHLDLNWDTELKPKMLHALLQPRYATSFHGSLRTLEAIQADQELQRLIRLEVVKAMDKVAANPRCPEPECPLLLRDAETIELELAPSDN